MVKENKEIKIFPIELNFKEAKYLSDLNSLVNDLQNTLITLNLLNDKYNGIDENDSTYDKNEIILLRRALMTSALISYTRCFNKGKRFELTTDIFDSLPNSEDVKKSHKHYTELRSKHFAHSINPYEQYQTIALYDEGTFYGIAYTNLYYNASSDVTPLINLTKYSLNYLSEKISLQHKIVHEKFMKMPIAEIEKLPKSKIQVARKENVSEPRL